MSGHNASRATRCLVGETRAGPSLTGSLRTGREAGRALLRVAVAGKTFAAAHLEAAPRALECAVAPFHRRGAARAGLDGGLGSRGGGRRCGHAETVGRAADVGREVGAPSPTRDTHLRGPARTPGRPALRCPGPTPESLRNARSRTQCHEARTAPCAGFTLCLQIEEATSGFEPLYEALQASA